MNKYLFLPVLVIPLFLTGCWDSVEINDRNVVLEMAIDKNMDPSANATDHKIKRYQVTYTIPDMEKISGENSLSEDVKTTIITQSPTVGRSIDEIETKAQNTITFSHTKAIVFGEDLLRDKELFKAAVDSLLRNMEIGRNTVVLSTQGEAKEVTTADNKQSPIVGLYVMKYFNNGDRATSYTKEQTIGNMVKELQSTGVTTIPFIKQDEGNAIQISGAAAIKDYELIDWLDKEDVRGELFVEGKIKEVPIVVKFKGDYLTYTIAREEVDLKFSPIDNTFAGTVLINTKGDITEYTAIGAKSIFDEADINAITKLVEEEIKKQVVSAIDKSKKMNLDFLNIGLAMYREHPKEWANYAKTWQDTGYQQFPLQVDVSVSINNTGVVN